ncbi:MAG: T9SS type A sorting domain-containing protein [Bacteroides sp.]|nr:T9SS type A sorting domain-containing protein [Ruminococcus flavefaciens]MCM1554133.1 T9SS type A sorting domain-containing protein [Bacteroides sp.]
MDTNYGVRWISLSPGLVDIVGDSGYVQMPVAEDSMVRIEAWKEDFSKHVYLTVRARKFVDREMGYDTVCPGDSVKMVYSYARANGWNYDVVWGEGDDTSPDTVYRLHLYHHPVYHDTLRFLEERDSLPYIYGEDTIRHFGLTELRRYQTVAGCDSIIYIQLDTLDIRREIHHWDTLHLCSGDTSLQYWRGFPIMGAGEVYDEVLDPYKGGTDNFYHLRVDIFPTYRDTLYFAFDPDSLPYLYGKDTIWQFGWTALKSLTVNGCDSVTYLYIHKERHFYDTLQSCGEAVLAWRGKKITVSGDYTDTLFDPYKGGTDSIYHLRADIYLEYHDTLYFVTERDSMPYIYGKDTIRQFGLTELYQYQTVHGCDSITYVQLDTLYIHRRVEIEDTMQGCEGDTLYWRGQEVTGYFARELVKDPYKGGTDTLFWLLVDRYPTYERTWWSYIYPDEMPYVIGTDTIRNFGLTELAYHTVHGCDSILYVWLNSYVGTLHAYDSLHTCQGDTLRWRGKVMTRTGDYTDTVFDPYQYGGPDSVYHLRAEFVTYRYISTDSCYIEELPYNLDGRQVPDFGSYTDRHVTASGCDSVHEYSLSRRWHHYRVQVETKGNGAANLTDTTLREDGTVRLRFTAASCHVLDSLRIDGRPVAPNTSCLLENLRGDCLVEAVFRESAPTESVLRYEVCTDSLPVRYNGESYGAGEHEIRFTDAAGCDSIVRLNVREKRNAARIAVTDTITPPCGANAIPVAYRIETGSPQRLLFRYDAAAHAAGFRDTAVDIRGGGTRKTDLPLPSDARSDRYSLQLWQADATGCYAQDETLTFEIPYPSSIIVQKWNDVLAVLSPEYNGGHEFSAYQWYADGEPLAGETRPYLYHRPYLPSTGRYSVLLERIADGIRLMSCPVKRQAYPKELALELRPNPAGQGSEVEVRVGGKPEAEGTVEVFDNTGRPVYSRPFLNGVHTLKASWQPGTYVVRVRGEKPAWTASGKLLVL